MKILETLKYPKLQYSKDEIEKHLSSFTFRKPTFFSNRYTGKRIKVYWKRSEDNENYYLKLVEVNVK